MKTLDTQGRLQQVAAPNPFVDDIFGDGSDSSPNFDGTNSYSAFASGPSSGIYTLIRSIYCQDLTVASGKTLRTAGFKIFCRGTLTNNGTISNAGLVGGAGAASGTAGDPGGAAPAGDVGGASVPGGGGSGGASNGGGGGSGAAASPSVGGSRS